MKRIFATVVLACVFLLGPTLVFAQPADIGEFCFRAETSTGSTYEYTLQVTDMGNSHFSLNGHVWPVAPPMVMIINPSFEPLHGVAEIRGDTVYMTLNKSSILHPAILLGDTIVRADTVYVEIPIDTLSNGTFRMIRQTHNIDAATDGTDYITGTFGLCP
jgi:hypothetical protein